MRFAASQVNEAILAAQENLQACDIRRVTWEEKLTAEMQKTRVVEQQLHDMRLNLTLLALRAEHEQQRSDIAEAGLDKLEAVCDRFSSNRDAGGEQAFHVAATSHHARAYAALPELPASLVSRLERGVDARYNHMLEILESVVVRRDAHREKVQAEVLSRKESC